VEDFVVKDAVRERVPLLIGLVGPSSSGKTYSALELATGIQSVAGGDIYCIDTEARRALHYADRFRFKHVEFGAPFGSLRYLAAIEQCVRLGAGVVIVDSMSHEHEGAGGLLESHEAEVQRLSRGDSAKAERVKMLAWNKPKQERRRLINSILQLPANFIFCFRAKEKLEVKPGREPRSLGFMAIAGDEFIYEMTVNALLLPGARGVPTWRSDEVGERQQIKLPEWAAPMFVDGRPLHRDTGAALARWAAGVVTRSIDELLAAYATCSTPASLGALEQERRAIWKSASAAEKERLKSAAHDASARVRAAESIGSESGTNETRVEREDGGA
jgi:hypothetical protein